MRKHFYLFTSTVSLLLGAAGATAQSGNSENGIEEIVIIGDTVGDLGLDSESSSGSRLGLTLRETPATIEVINKEVLRSRGYQKLTDAAESLPGVVSGDHPASPSTFSMRGFTRGQVSILRDGLWIGPSSMVMRPQNTFNLERVEVLRGPASVLNGNGAVGSTVNTVARTAVLDAETNYDLLLDMSRFNSFQAGFGAGGSFSADTGWRLDASTYGSEGYVENTDPESTNITGSFVWRLAEDKELKLSADFLNDDVGQYFGTPLVPVSAANRPMTDIISTASNETIDEDMRFKNYNVEDGKAEAEQLFLRADFSWEIADNIRLDNTLYTYDADREWINAEGYVYCTSVIDVCNAVGDIQRYYGYFFVFHEQEQWGNRLTLNIDGEVGGMRNRFLAGTEFLDIDFVRSRGFRRSIPPVPGDSVNPYNPVRGQYGQLELRGVSPTEISSWALFAENALQLTDRFSLVGALRYEELDLDRKNFNASGVSENNGFARVYDWWSWRAGAVFDLSEDITLYGQYSDAVDPIGSNIFLVNSNNNFDLTSASQWEVGLKSSFGRTEMTLAWFDISRDDILERFALDSASNIGGQDSQGLEFALTSAVSDRWKVGVNAGLTDAEFKRSANNLVNAGNNPPNVPDLTANAWTSVSEIAGLPLELGGGWRFVDDRFGDNRNQVTLKSYHLFDAYAAWVQGDYRLTFRVDNATDEAYVAWSDVFYLGQTDPSFIYANQVMLGAPRSYSLSLQWQF